MKTTIAAAALLVMGWAVLGGAAYAQDAAQFGYVDMRKAVTESKNGQRIKAELEKFAKQKQEQLAKEEQKVRDVQHAFEKDQLLMTDAQKRDKQKEIQEKIQAFQKMAGEAQREFNQKEQEHTRKVVTEIRAIVAEIAKAEKLALVFEKNDAPVLVLYAEEGPDLTERVMKAYDAKAGNK